MAVKVAGLVKPMHTRRLLALGRSLSIHSRQTRAQAKQVNMDGKEGVMRLQPKVVIVVDRTFGDRLLSLFRSFNVWVVESADNLPAIQAAWTGQNAATNSAPTTAVTSFKALEGESPDDMCARIAGDVDEHHGELAQDRAWREIEIFGVSLNGRLRSVFEELGANTFELTKGGFICRRSRDPLEMDRHGGGPDWSV